MRHITYHYLLNTSRLDGNYIYDVNHLPNKHLQKRIYINYLKDRLYKMKWAIDNNYDVERIQKELDEVNQQTTLRDKVNVLFRSGYDRTVKDILGKPYFGVWGIHTTPANLFGVDNRYKYRLVIDCDTVDPEYTIIRVKNTYVKYSIANYEKYCIVDSSAVNTAYSDDKPRTVSGSMPDVVFYLPRLRFDKSDIEVYKK